jgi:outer membrane protein assembly factor BamD (BamD/ComL family)
VNAQTSDGQTRMLADIEERTREAWSLYSESLRDLQGQDYEEAERESWGRLQKELEGLTAERALAARD